MRSLALRSPRAADGGAILLLLLMVALFFWRVWAPNPADRLAFPIGDFTDQYFPLRHFVAVTLAEGRLPFWNPFLFGGQPGLADPQAAVLYPPALLNALLWGAGYDLAALQLEAIAHVGLAAAGTYLFARLRLAMHPLPALFAALLWTFSGYLTGFPLEQVTILETVTWLPWLLLAVGQAAEAPRWPRRLLWSGAISLLTALLLLAGHPQSALYLLYTGALYALFCLWRARRSGTLYPAPPIHLLPLLLAFALGAGLAAPQLLPTARFIEESSRQALNYDFVRGGLVWEELSLLFLPKIVGSTPLYLAIFPLLLLPLGLTSGEQRAEKRFWGGTALFTLLVALGGNSALFDLLYLGVPGIARVRSQERILLLWSWSVALLAAWGLAFLLSAARQPAARARLRRYSRTLGRWLPIAALPWLLLWVVHALVTSQITLDLQVLDAFWGRYSFFLLQLVLGWGLLWWASRRAGTPRALLLLALLGLTLSGWDLWTINRGQHHGPPVAEALPPRTPVVDALFAWQGAAPARIQVVGNPVPRSNDGMRWGFPLLSGNEPLRLAASEDFLREAEPWNQLQAFAVGYIVADRPLDEEAPELYERLAATDTPSPSFLFRVRPPMPYAWLVGQSQSFDSVATLLDHLDDNVPDLHQIAMLEQPLPLAPLALPPGAGVSVQRDPHGATFEVENPAMGNALLVIAEPATAGWHLTVDGTATSWLRANGLNVALPIPPGTHRVTMRYQPPGWQEGVWIAAASALLLLAALAAGAWGTRRESAWAP